MEVDEEDVGEVVVDGRTVVPTDGWTDIDALGTIDVDDDEGNDDDNTDGRGGTPLISSTELCRLLLRTGGWVDTGVGSMHNNCLTNPSSLASSNSRKDYTHQ
jgi:hypothetical protein